MCPERERWFRWCCWACLGSLAIHGQYSARTAPTSSKRPLTGRPKIPHAPAAPWLHLLDPLPHHCGTRSSNTFRVPAPNLPRLLTCPRRLFPTIPPRRQLFLLSRTHSLRSHPRPASQPATSWLTSAHNNSPRTTPKAGGDNSARRRLIRVESNR